MFSPASRSRHPKPRELLQCVTTSQCCPRASRAISTNSAIARGLYATSAADRRYPGSKSRPLFRREVDEFAQRSDRTGLAEDNAKYWQKKEKRVYRDTAGGQRPEGKRELFRGPIRLAEHEVREVPEHPVSVPYATAASQFLYGASAVRAALVAKRRKCYKLYIHERALRREGPRRERFERTPNIRSLKEREMEDDAAHTLIELAEHFPNLEVKKVDDSWLPVMDKMAGGRPHNGVILDASPLPALPITSLRPANRLRHWFEVDTDKQSREEAHINGHNNRLAYNSHGWRFPFILYLDGIVDEGNLGAIMRSAYYLGVDAVALSKRATAPVDAVAIKASSGAAEAMPLLTVANPLSFLTRSTLNGWRVYAADAPLPPKENFNVTSSHYAGALDPKNTSPLISFTRPHTRAVLRDHSPLAQHPSILMLGGESAGFRQSIRAKANYLVGIRGIAPGIDLGVDSLNVSVAAALIMLELLRKPSPGPPQKNSSARTVEAHERDDEFVKHKELLF